jgi:hypothetical protein
MEKNDTCPECNKAIHKKQLDSCVVISNKVVHAKCMNKRYSQEKRKRNA